MTSSATELFGIMHVLAMIASIAAAVIAARYAARFVAGAEPGDREQRLLRVLFITGIALVVLEVLKQMYLQMISGGGSYDWWYFPFQLCSVPMYLCVLLPIVKGSLRSALLTFMSGYTFVSAMAALIYPEDILNAAPPLVFHGFLWHAILLFISMFIFMTGAADVSSRGLTRAAGLFLMLCVIAIAINVLTEPVMQAGSAAHSYAAMFYLNPYHISPQPVVSAIQKAAGIPAGLLIYIIAISAASSLFTVLLGRKPSRK